MTDRDALYAAVLARPDDDTPRLVYADYLDDTGDRMDGTRARFIRNQIALARAEPWSAEADRLVRATAPVESHYGKQWAGDLGGIALAARFGRGFVEEVTCYAKRFVADGAALFERHPIRAVKFADMSGGRATVTGAELAACPLLARLHTLHLVGSPINDTFADRLTRSRHLDGLRCLRVERSALGPEGVAWLVERAGQAPFELDLSRNANVGDREVMELGLNPKLARLRALDLSECAAGPDGWLRLARSKFAAGLEVLGASHSRDYGRNPLRGPGAVALAQSPHFRGLKELSLNGQELRKRGTEAFAAAYVWPGLKRLGLRGNQIPASALPAFAANPYLRSLAVLDLRSNPIKADDLTALAEACPDTRILTDDRDRLIRLDRLAPEDRL